ncbi:MAG: DUF4330 domain-containing protein [Oscillospiraceae bacterium]|jgi:hypothetical protein|nr:DUF4330 domain-containing protein [Oscillospiraceae bacterium]
MKVVNEKGKLFGVINLVDLFVVIFVLLVGAGVVWKVFGTQVNQIVASPTDITFTVRIKGTHPRYYDSLTANGFPQQILAGDSFIADAYIVSCEKQDYITQVITSDGRIVDAKDGTKIDALVTIQAKVSDTAAIKLGTQEIRAAKEYIVKTKYFEMYGTIETILIDR